MLEVSCDGKIISQSATFEYKERHNATTTSAAQNHNSYLSKEKLLRTLLLQKLEALDICTFQDKNSALELPLDTEVRKDWKLIFKLWKSNSEY